MFPNSLYWLEFGKHEPIKSFLFPLFFVSRFQKNVSQCMFFLRPVYFSYQRIASILISFIIYTNSFYFLAYHTKYTDPPEITIIYFLFFLYLVHIAVWMKHNKWILDELWKYSYSNISQHAVILIATHIIFSHDPHTKW